MPIKYRKLSKNELQELEKEFIDYLVVNGITADEWVTIKSEKPAEVERIIELFSDVVFEGIMRKTKYLDYRSKQEILTFFCLDKKIQMVGLEVASNNPDIDKIDLSDNKYIDSALKKPPKGLEIFSDEKPYDQQRELEIFSMIQEGCEISDGKLFKALSIVLAENTSELKTIKH